MSNKPKQFKKSNNSIQIGNFYVSFGNGLVKSVKITSVAGNWNIRYGEDNMLFSWISNEIKTEDGRNILHLTFATWYAACNGVPDSLFMEDVIHAYQRSVERMKQGIQELSDEADQAIIEEEKEKYKSFKPESNDIAN